MAWTEEKDIIAELERRWNDGGLVAGSLRGEPIFPYRVRFSSPRPRDLASRIIDVRDWAERLRRASRDCRGTGFELEWTEHNNRETGRNRVPSGAVIPSRADALGLLRREVEAAAFDAATELTTSAEPRLTRWLARYPLRAISQAAVWSQLLAVVRWFSDHPRSGLFLRQIDVPGVDTKFIEQHKALIAELLSELSGDTPSPSATFEERFGLRAKPPLVRLRVLGDERLSVIGLTDISGTVEEMARLPIRPARVFVTENEVNGLTFPDVPMSVVIFGRGYGVERIAELPWVRAADVSYWGDIDTHGFAILDGLRNALPSAQSLLMDRETLLAHRPLWVREEEQETRELLRLTTEERALYDDLRFGRLGERVRFEQERVRFSFVQDAIRAPRA